MDSISIQSTQHQYKVSVGLGLRFQINNLLPKHYEKILVITDSVVNKLSFSEELMASVEKTNSQVYKFIIPAGEQSKSIEQFEKIQTYAIECGLDRNSLIITLGGGVVGDIGGFVAATYMRGIDFAQIPTTVLAHDSSVGGKVAINHPLGKNLIGSFHQPVAVIYDLETLYTLPQEEVRSGFAEVIKHAWIADKELLYSIFNQVNSLKEIDESILHQSIVRGIEIKASIVEQDEKEKGVRSFLNFGHTLGHAIESESGYGKINHGEAIAIGMLFALQLSAKTYSTHFPIKQFTNWLKKLDYPIQKIKGLDVQALVEKMKNDKKNSKGQIHMVLLKEIGKPELVPLDDQFVTSELSKFQEEVII